MNFPAPVGLLSASAGLEMPFPDAIKYGILGVSVALLLLALGILAWQAFRCFTQTRNTSSQTDEADRDLLYPHIKPTTVGLFLETPTIKEENVSTEFRRLSCCLSQALFPDSGSILIDSDTGEQTNVKADGSLRFSIYYDQQRCRLVVTVLEVEVLQEQSHTGSLQLFVMLRLMWAGSDDHKDKEGEGTPPALCTVLQEWRSCTVKGSCKPLFGDQFSCILQDPKELHHIKLRMEVRNFDKFSKDTVLGEVRVPLGQLDISYPLELKRVLQTPQKDLVGEVLLSLKFLPTSQRLEVGLLKVKTVFSDIRSDSALYARISVQCNQCKLRYQRTSAVERGIVTVFNEVLIFALREFPLEQCKILVSVYETHTTRKSTKHLIGQLTVKKEKNSEDKHWGLMMRSVRQPIAEWHSLLI
ncbi:synaptotagmin-2 isoform 1-T2 [Aulostomus maculatus]